MFRLILFKYNKVGNIDVEFWIKWIETNVTSNQNSSFKNYHKAMAAKLPKKVMVFTK